MSEARRTPLFDLHVEWGGKMVDFAGWSLPVNYPGGIKAEHLWCREKAALFDVSHMTQLEIRASDGFAGAALEFERLVPSSIGVLKEGRARYTALTTESGGVIDDLIATHGGDHLFLVLNAARREADLAHLRAEMHDVEIVERTDRALLAIQGPAAEAVLAEHAPIARELAFMQSAETELAGARVRISRLGYTGEDGFEIASPAEAAESVARALARNPQLAPAGLGARDSLRLEAGLCLWGAELDLETSPIRAGLSWIVQKRRRFEGGFLGAEPILAELLAGPRTMLRGLAPRGRAPARAGVEIRAPLGEKVGVITSGGYSPSLDAPISIGHVAAPWAEPGTQVELIVRGRALEAEVRALPFVAHRYKR